MQAGTISDRLSLTWSSTRDHPDCPVAALEFGERAAGSVGRSRGRPNSALGAPMLSHRRSGFRFLYGTRCSSRSKTYGSILSYDGTPRRVRTREADHGSFASWQKSCRTTARAPTSVNRRGNASEQLAAHCARGRWDLPGVNGDWDRHPHASLRPRADARLPALSKGVDYRELATENLQ